MPTFGEIISEKRKKAGLSQKELATRVTKEDGKPISPQYLNDIERDRRNPPSEHLIEQFASILSIAPETLYYCAGELPPSVRYEDVSERMIAEAFKEFRKVIERKDPFDCCSA